jgi:Holliday junction resolvase Gen1 C-terminal domain
VHRYTSPATSATERYASYAKKHTWSNPPNVPSLVDRVTLLFEWTHREIHQKFRNVLFHGLIFACMRRFVLAVDAGELPPSIISLDSGVSQTADRPSRPQGSSPDALPLVETHSATSTLPPPSQQTALTSHFKSSKPTRPSHAPKPAAPVPVPATHPPSITLPMVAQSIPPQLTICSIHKLRQHASTGRYLEHRIEIAPTAWVRTIRESLTHPDPNIGKAQERKRREAIEAERRGEAPRPAPTGPPRQRHYDDPDSTLRFWIPAAVLEMVCPLAIQAFDTRMASRDRQKQEMNERRQAKARQKQRVDSNSAGVARVRTETIVDLLNRAPATNLTTTSRREVLDLRTDSDGDSGGGGGGGAGEDARAHNRTCGSLGSRRRENVSSDSSTISSTLRPRAKLPRYTRTREDPKSADLLLLPEFLNGHSDDDETHPLTPPTSILGNVCRGKQLMDRSLTHPGSGSRTGLLRPEQPEGRPSEIIDLTHSP